MEATSPGLTAATASVAAKAVKLRPQVAAWERAVPTGAGITGLWRPAAAAAAAAPTTRWPWPAAAVDMVFTFRQDGAALTGSLEAAGGGGFGGGGVSGGPIEEGKVEGATVSFRVGTTTYSGTVQGEQIELQRTAPARRPGAAPAAATADAGARPAVGPPPPGSDPSFGSGRAGQAPAPIVLRRVTQ